MHPYKQLAPPSRESLSIQLNPKPLKGLNTAFKDDKNDFPILPPKIGTLHDKSANTTLDDSVASERDIIDKYSKFPPPEELNTGDILGDLDFMDDQQSTSKDYTFPRTVVAEKEPSIQIPQSPIALELPTSTVNDSQESLAISHNRTPSGQLLSMGTSLQMYGENAKRTKDPAVLLSYAQVLIKSALSNQTDESITEKNRSQYLDEAHSVLKKASRQNGLDAQYYLGDAYYCGLFNKGKPDYTKALSCFEAAGKAKHAESAYRTAICYRKGLGCTRDSRKVVKFLEIATLNGHPVAMMEYGIFCFHGLMGLPEDTNTKKKGISWLRRATECATPLSCGAPYELALIYMNGFRDIVIKDVQYAIKLLFKATNLGHGKSAVMLGKIYEIGDVITANHDLSIHFYTLAAEMGEADGMMGLCSWYFVGSQNLLKNYNEAFNWALKAAELNSPKAMLLLQRFYKMGLGCEQNESKARYWGEEAERVKGLQRDRK